MKKYVTVETLPNGEKTIRIDWDKINSITDQEEMDKVTEFYDEIDGWLEDIYDAEETQEDNTDAIAELLQEGKDDYLNLEEQVRDAIEKQRQDEIDSLSELNDVITETNSQLLDAMQTSIDEYRQARDNEETEEELSDKQRRLAYLQQDTSGANALEILQLQEELDEATEDYTDTLIDQKISELQKQNDEAAEQRQRQIDIMQQQLDYYLESGQVWEDVEELIAGALNEDGTVKPDSALMDLLKEGADWDSMSEIAQMDWLKDTNTMIAMGLDWLTGQGILSTFFSGQEIEFTTADGQTVKGTVQADGTVVDSEGNVYENVTWDGSSFSTTENKKVKPEDPDPPEAPEVTTNDKKGVSAAIWNGGYGWGTGSTRVKRLKEVFGDNDI